LIDSKPINFATIGYILGIPDKCLYSWYRKYLSGFPEAQASGEWGKNDFVSYHGREPSHCRVQAYFFIHTNAEDCDPVG